jgi:DNA ligase 1
MMGALMVRNNEGIEFKIGSGFTDADRRNPPKIGSIVTYKYYELTKNGKPRFPIYLRPYQAL